MKQQMDARMKKLAMAVCLGIGGVLVTTPGNAQGKHPAYLHAISDLRAARWLIEHKTGNWEQSMDEHEAVKQIDAALKEIKEAAIDDGKNVNDHPPVDERPDHNGRLRGAIDFLNRAHDDLAREEDNGFSNNLRDRSWKHISKAIENVKRAMRDH